MDEVAEWLRRWTANPMGSARVGSNPILVVSFLPLLWIFKLYLRSFHPSFAVMYVGKARGKKLFRYRESNPGLLGESQLS